MRLTAALRVFSQPEISRSRSNAKYNGSNVHAAGPGAARVQPSLNIRAVGLQRKKKNKTLQHSCGLACAALRVFSPA
jgi:hypothetical protein